MERFKDKATFDLWDGNDSKIARRAIPSEYRDRARIRLDLVYQASTLEMFSKLPPGVQFKTLRGMREGVYQIRIGGPYRIRFSWAEERAVDIEAGNFHDED